MQNVILTPISVHELVQLIACEVEHRVSRPEPKDPPQLKGPINLNEICKLTDYSKSQIYKLSMRGEIPVWHYGKNLVSTREAILEWRENRTISKNPNQDLVTDNLAKTAKKQLKKY